MASAQDKLIKDVVKAFEKKFGPGHATTLTKMFSPEKVRGFVPTGNLAIDYVIGRPGFPIGRITEIAGPYSAGKSSVCACAIGAAQKAGIVTILIDTEHSYSSEWSEMWGVNPERLILVQPKHLQDVFDKLRYVITLIKEDQPETPIFIVIDSVSASPSAEELEEEDSTSGKQRAQHAKIISEGLRKISDLVWNQNVCVLFVSQLKDDPGSIYGANKHKLGGHAIEFHASLMIEVRRNAYLKEKDEVYGQKIVVNSTKNKFVPPFRKRIFDLYFKEGIRPKEILLEFLGDSDLYPDGKAPITKAGGWFEYNGAKYRKEDLAAQLDDSIMQNVYKTLNIVVSPPKTPVVEDLKVRTVSNPAEIQQSQEESQQEESNTQEESKVENSNKGAAVENPADTPTVNIKDIM